MAENLAAALAKRGTPSAWPHELHVVDDPTDPLYDERLYSIPLTDAAIMNFAARGQIQPIAVRLRGDLLVVVGGRQRWKRATVINHLAGVQQYRGRLKPVLEAIERLKDSDAGRRIVELCPKGMKLQFSLYRDTEHSAALASISENEFRTDDPVQAKARKAQRLARQGFGEAELAEEFSVSMPTIKRWLAVDTEAPKTRKTRGKAARPSKAKIQRALESEAFEQLDEEVRTLMLWHAGRVTDEKLIEVFPAMRRVLDGEAKQDKAA